MPEIVGGFLSAQSTRPAIDGHLTHIGHLSSSEVATRLLRQRHAFRADDARNWGSHVAAHAGQAIEFYEHSRRAPRRVRPMLQYYSYLNLAVATILAYRPAGFERYKTHGVSDLSGTLTTLTLRSPVVRVSPRGAIPLLHSILSDEPIANERFRVNELLAAVPMVSAELQALFALDTQHIVVSESLQKATDGLWASHVEFTADSTLGRKRLERAMPSLRTRYRIAEQAPGVLHYISRNSWASDADANAAHRKLSLKLINFGGHSVTLDTRTLGRVHQSILYSWYAVPRKRLLPTLSACLLLSFGLSSICRYRASLVRSLDDSPLRVLIDTFVNESDAVVIPAFRNLLYREEYCISPYPAL